MSKSDHDRIVITGVGVISPLGNTTHELRSNILNLKSGITSSDYPYFPNTPTGRCVFDSSMFQNKKMLNRGTRSGSIAIYCARQAILDSKILWDDISKKEVGVILGLAEHGSNETSLEINKLKDENAGNIDYWSPYHGFKIIMNSPSGEVSSNLGITGPHYTVSSACSSGNLAIIQAVQQILLGEINFAICGGISAVLESYIGLASFKAQGILATHLDPQKASRPLDSNRNGVVLSEGGGILFLERLSSAIKRNATIYCEIESYHSNSDAHDYTQPLLERQVECIEAALSKASLVASNIDLVNLHATGTQLGDILECRALQKVFKNSPDTFFNSSKGALGHAMGASSVVEVIANIPSFADNLIHPSINIDELDTECYLSNLVINKPVKKNINRILKNSFGMMGANSCIIYKKYPLDLP